MLCPSYEPQLPSSNSQVEVVPPPPLLLPPPLHVPQLAWQPVLQWAELVPHQPYWEQHCAQ